MVPAEPGKAPQVAITVVWSPAAREVRQLALAVPVGTTVAQALIQAVLSGGLPQEVAAAPWGTSIWGRKVAGEEVLRDGDRLACCRALTVDPKQARRERYRAQGKRLPKGTRTVREASELAPSTPPVPSTDSPG